MSEPYRLIKIDKTLLERFDKITFPAWVKSYQARVAYALDSFITEDGQRQAKGGAK